MRAVDILQRLHLRYAQRVAFARRPSKDQIPPVRRPTELLQYANLWVAVIGDHEVIAWAPTSRELARKLLALGPVAQEAVVQFVRPAVASYIIGVG